VFYWQLIGMLTCTYLEASRPCGLVLRTACLSRRAAGWLFTEFAREHSKLLAIQQHHYTLVERFRDARTSPYTPRVATSRGDAATECIDGRGGGIVVVSAVLTRRCCIALCIPNR